MLNFKVTRFSDSNASFQPVATGVVVAEDGVALVYAKESGDTKVQPSTGVAGEVYAGVSLSRNTPPNQVPAYEEFVIPASGSVQLNRTPVAGQLSVKGFALGSGAPAAGEVKITADTLQFNTADAGKVATAQYLYEPTVAEAATIIGQGPIGGPPSSALGVVGVLEKGEFGTSFFDASVDWTDALAVNLGAGGKFTVGGSGTRVPGLVVKNAPNAGNPFLVLKSL